MTSELKSAVLILPSALRDAGNAVAEAMGWGPDNYSIPLSPTAKTPATHYGLRSWVDDRFEGWVTGREPLPQGMEAAQPVIDALIYSFRPDGEHIGHFADVLAANGLAQIEGGDA